MPDDQQPCTVADATIITGASGIVTGWRLEPDRWQSSDTAV